MVEICYASLALILFDIVTGVIAAAKNKELSSSAMRNGLYNKMGEMLLLAFAVTCHFILGLEPFHEIGIPQEIACTVAVYIAGMEVLSVIENICKINPELPFTKLLMMFNIKVEEHE